MWHKFLFILTTVLAVPTQAAELGRDTITSCTYQAGTAYEVQKIRQTQGDDWDTFEANIKKIYKDTQGRQDLLNIAKRVYFHPSADSADAIEAEIFDACVQRQQNTEPET